MEFEKVLNGIMKYLNNEIYAGMNEWQEMLARIAVSRIIGNEQNLKNMLVTNPFIKTFAIIDQNGMVDVEGLMRDIKTQIQAKEKISFSLPIFGRFTFTASDVDKLHRTILEG
ncbi:MAG: hypothetical protein U0M60_15430 [Clostridia bacterium]|jgi:hypothetical protein|nr:hypothetical protein [Clostridia bacterium]